MHMTSTCESHSPDGAFDKRCFAFDVDDLDQPTPSSAPRVCLKVAKWHEALICPDRGPTTRVWCGLEGVVDLPKPGTGKSRRAHLLASLMARGEADAICRLAQGGGLNFGRHGDSVDQQPTFEFVIMDPGSRRYNHSGIRAIVEPFVQERLLPYVRQRCSAPGAEMSTAILRRYRPGERRVHPAHFDASAFCTAVVGLNPEDFDGGLYVQTTAHVSSRAFVPLAKGDTLVHQYDLPHGVHVFGGVRYSLVIWIKCCSEAVTLNSSPWYHAAAAAGDADAQSNLGQNYYAGMGGEEQDASLAKAWLTRAANQGQAQAQHLLGCMYVHGNGVAASRTRGIEWCRRSALQGYADAQRQLGISLLEQLVVDSDAQPNSNSPSVALEWLRMAAEQDNRDAMFQLHKIFKGGTHGVIRDKQQANLWVRRAAAQCHPLAQSALGFSYLSGDDLVGPQDLKSAVRWLRRGATNGARDAQLFLGTLLASHAAQAPELWAGAIFWLAGAAKQGSLEAQSGLGRAMLGDLAAVGSLGTKRGPDRCHRVLLLATSWLATAAGRGCAVACEKLRSLDLHGARRECHEHAAAAKTGDGAAEWQVLVWLASSGGSPAAEWAEASPNAAVAPTRSALVELTDLIVEDLWYQDPQTPLEDDARFLALVA